MSNQKFFSGLTNKMMEKDLKVPDRQRSHLFWPDESHLESVSTSSHRTKPGGRQTSTPVRVNNQTTEYENVVTPRERFNHQLTSKVEFFDDVVDSSPHIKSPTVQPAPVSEKYCNDNRKHNLNSSIQFYDFVEDNKNISRNLKKKEEPNNKRINNVQVEKKRISFNNSPTPEKEIFEVKKSILKNQKNQPEVIIKNKTYSQQPKKSLSKSVENLAMRNGQQTNQNPNRFDEEMERVEKKIRNIKISNVKNKEQDHHYERRESNERSYNDRNKKNNFEDSYFNPEPDRNRNINNHRRNTIFQQEEDNLQIIGSAKYRQEQDRNTKRNYNNGGRYHQVNNDDDDYQREPIRQSVQRERRIEINLDEDSSDRGDYGTPLPRNEVRQRAQTQLKSNISFFSDANDSDYQKRPLSVRDSAVYRVGVGLPDF